MGQNSNLTAAAGQPASHRNHRCIADLLMYAAMAAYLILVATRPAVFS